MAEKLGILTFPGLPAPGPINLIGANPGDVIVSVGSITAGQFGVNFTDAFMREVQFLPTGTFPFIVQTSSINLSAMVFVALVRKKDFDIPND